MAKAPKSAPAEEESSSSAPSEYYLPGIFGEAEKAWGSNPDYWPIWLKNEYHAWKAGGPMPEGNLSEVLGKKKEEA